MPQLHLTDDQGWRIEVRKHFRNLGQDNALYSGEKLADLIRYAAERHVEIVPELDIPGHIVAVSAAYPLNWDVHTQIPLQRMYSEVVNLMLCANNEKVYEVYKDIFDEVSALFPSRYSGLGW
ncbi:MAG: family 20 glycosylhydrolase [Bacteroides fragilis]